MRTLIAAALSGCMLTAGCDRQESLESIIASVMEDGHIAGLAVAALDSGRVVWTGTYGFADMDERRPVTDSTPFQLASVSKVITATVLLSQFAAGRFALDDDINEHLPFAVRNPNHPAVPITIRQLLIHRSGITDNAEYFRPFWSEAHGDYTDSLSTFLRDYLTPEGSNYSAGENFLDVVPGERTSYCNVCFALVGYLAQEISGVPFEQLSRDVLFAPLGLRETGWFVRDFPAHPPAMPYRFRADTGYVAYGQNGYPDWPAGMLRMSIRDLSRFLSAYLADGRFEDRAVIDARVIEAMTPLDPHVGFLTWAQIATTNLEVLYSHGGGDIGVRTVMSFTHRGKRGVIVLSNGEASVGRIADAVFVRIGSLAGSGR